MPDEPGQLARLTGWKAIGHHLGVAARTAQRWERGRGLPVERLDAAARVTADPGALDRWRAAAAAKPNPRFWENPQTLQMYSLSTTILLILAIGFLYVRVYAVGAPATFRVDGNLLRVLDRKGKPIWVHAFENLPAPYLYSPDKIGEHVALVDLNGSGPRALLF